MTDPLCSNSTVSVTCRVLHLEPVRASRLIALASVELELDGIVFALHGVQVVRSQKDGREATGVELPCHRAHDGRWRPSISLPEELQKPIAAIVLQECLDAGLVKPAVMTTAGGSALPAPVPPPP